MKKIKILSLLLALLMCTSVLFISCEKEEVATYTISDIMNSEWSLDKTGVVTSFKDASYVGDYAKASYGFIVTTFDPNSANSGNNTNNTDNTSNAVNGVVTRVYNANTDQVVVTLTDSKTTDSTVTPAVTTTKKNYVNIISYEYFAVLSASTTLSGGSSITASNYFGCPLTSSWDYTLSIYNSTGSVVETFYNNELLALCEGNISNFDKAYAGFNEYGSANEDAIIYEYKDVVHYLDDEFDLTGGFDLFAIGSKVYRFDEDYKTTLVKDYGLAAKPSLTSMKKVGDNYLETKNNVYTVYDKDLNKVFDYTVPGYANGDAHILANGNLLVQYVIQLDQNEKKFDVREGADGKYDLVTVLVTKDAVTELEDVNYYIGSLKPSVAGRDGKKVYADTVENLAFIYPIGENKMIDMSYSNKKLVLISNEGLVTAEVNVEGKFADFPINHTNNYYAIKLSDGGYAIYNKQGEKVSTLTASAMEAYKISGDYMLTTNAIYKADGSVAYDIDDAHASVKQCGNTVIVAKYATKATAYGIFVDGDVKNIGTVAVDENNSTIDDFGYGEYGYYYTYNKETKKYTYYNEEGNTIGSFDKQLTYRLSGEDFIIMQDTANKIFYKFIITK